MHTVLVLNLTIRCPLNLKGNVDRTLMYSTRTPILFTTFNNGITLSLHLSTTWILIMELIFYDIIIVCVWKYF